MWVQGQDEGISSEDKEFTKIGDSQQIVLVETWKGEVNPRVTQKFHLAKRQDLQILWVVVYLPLFLR